MLARKKPGALILGAVLWVLCAQAGPKPPAVMVWAWEQPMDLRRLDQSRVGVAFYAAMLGPGQDGHVRVELRRQSLRTAFGAFEMPVVRLSSYGLGASHMASAAAAVMKIVQTTKARAVQIDYDAPASELKNYRGLLRDLRARLGPEVFLSITALASWCGQDSWLQDLPVDEVVPMAFRMGAEDPAWRNMLAAGRDFAAPACRNSLGVTLDEKLPAIPPRQRIYIFTGWQQPDTRLDELTQKLEQKR
ncbi:DUF3142 domain-containing protein [Paludibaculum fermentans]|uniref:DUF3142 domain-containing protein n=1 Tax=Paludibaculum fermentans TaxID=1473598 RepID=UPI003EBCF099